MTKSEKVKAALLQDFFNLSVSLQIPNPSSSEEMTISENRKIELRKVMIDEVADPLAHVQRLLVDYLNTVGPDTAIEAEGLKIAEAARFLKEIGRKMGIPPRYERSSNKEAL